MSEFYTVKTSPSTTIGNYGNVDEAEIVKVLNPNSVMITQNLNVEFEQYGIGCHEDNGEFYLMNDMGDRVCTLQVKIETHDCSDWIDSTQSIEIDLSEEYYHAFINQVEINNINLTDGLKREINNEIDNFIARTNDKNK
jgi:hypothetical protein